MVKLDEEQVSGVLAASGIAPENRISAKLTLAKTLTKADARAFVSSAKSVEKDQ